MSYNNKYSEDGIFYMKGVDEEIHFDLPKDV